MITILEKELQAIISNLWATEHQPNMKLIEKNLQETSSSKARHC